MSAFEWGRCTSFGTQRVQRGWACPPFTVTLGLLAFHLAGVQAGAILGVALSLGTALSIEMIAYVGVAPVTAAFTQSDFAHEASWF